MKTTLISLAFLLCLCQFANAQTTDSPSSRNHFGVIASPTLDKVFTSNSNLPVGLIYKRQGKGNGMFRSTLMGSQDGYDHDNEHRGFHLTNYQMASRNYFNIQLTAGYEWHLPLSNRWGFYYGAEAGPTFARGTYNEKTINPIGEQETVENSYRTNSFGVILRPFSGITFQISDRLYIATETAIVAGLNRNKSASTYKNTSPGQQSFGDNSYKFTSSSIRFKPISNISLLMRF